jgi:type II secretory pathway component PulF
VQTVAAALQVLDDGKHRAEFYRMWRAGYSAAFTHPKSLETMGPRQSALTEDVRKFLLDGTKRGKGIADLVKTDGPRFEEFERALLTLGDESGSLDSALRLLGDFYTSKYQLMIKVKNKLTYPMFNGLAACFIAPFKLAFDGKVGAYFAIALGGVTVLFLFAGGIIAGFATRYGAKPPLARARMARALATAVEAGLSLPRSLRLAADASANPEIKAFVLRQSEKQLASRSIVESLAGCPHITPDFVGYLQTSEKTGDFTPLSRLAELYEDGFR